MACCHNFVPSNSWSKR